MNINKTSADDILAEANTFRGRDVAGWMLVGLLAGAGGIAIGHVATKIIANAAFAACGVQAAW